MTVSEKLGLFTEGMILVAICLALAWFARYMYYKRMRTKNRKYNQFGKSPLSNSELEYVKRWTLNIP